MDNSVALSVGDIHRLRLGKDRIVYAGMPNENVFSFVQMKWEFFYRGYSWNLYFPKGQSTIRIDGVNIQVESVTPEEIRLRV
ncbi:MAG TPA: hypothetical protein G4N93_04935 [Dehalococcoidia bacterium]|nr:hypothetical protein [Dehalococcoidia bacterium]